MAATLAPRPDVPIVDRFTTPHLPASLVAMAERLEAPLSGDDRPTERRRRAEQLVHEAGSDRAAMEQLQYHYLQRLHAVSDDYAAAEALRTVEVAIAMVPLTGPSKGGRNEEVPGASRRGRRRRRR